MKKYLFIILILSCSFKGLGQDVGLWTGISLEKKLTRSFSANVNAETRFSDNVSELNAYLAEAGLEYKINKYLKAEANYRFTGERKRDKSTSDGYYYRPYHRFYGSATFDFEPAKWLRFAYRLRYQNQFKDDELGLVNDGSYFRHRAEFPTKTKAFSRPTSRPTPST